MVLFEPEIPPNTGNIIRLCANTGASLHLLGPLGFTLDEPRLRRAGLDYAEWARVERHDDLAAFTRSHSPPRLYAFTTRATQLLASARFAPGDAFVFGPETRGLPDDVLAQFTEQQRVRIPMRANSRSLNLSNAVAVVCYEAWRQLGFRGAV